MRTSMKKCLFFFLLLHVVLSLCACGSGGKSSLEPLGDVCEIPEDGIITKDQFETFAGEDRSVVFTGESEGIRYSWTFEGRQIQNPKDQNLKLSFETENLEDVKEAANHASYILGIKMEGEELICAPSIEIVLEDTWETANAVLVKEQKGKLARVSDIAVDTSEEGKTILRWNLTSLYGQCYIVAGKSSAGMSGADDSLVNPADPEAGADGSVVDPDGQKNSPDSQDSKIESVSDYYAAGASSGADTAQDGMPADRQDQVSSGTGSQESDKNTSGASSASSGKKKNSGSKKETSSHTCQISISCATILDHMDQLAAGKEEFVPSNGWILKNTKVTFEEGDTVYDVLVDVCKSKGIHMEAANSIAYGTAYIEGINQLYEFDCGELSGWMFSVNGWYPNYGAGKYTVSDGDVIAWVYTCELGQDIN